MSPSPSPPRPGAPCGNRACRRLAAAATALLLLGAADSGLADPQEPAWDQEKVAGLADALAVSLDGIVNAPAMSDKQPTAFQDRNLHAALVDLKQMAQAARSLAAKLRAGASPEQTQPIFRQITVTREGVRMYAENTEVPASVQAKAANAIVTLDELQKYYAPY